jgi:hypothetical protein
LPDLPRHVASAIITEAGRLLRERVAELQDEARELLGGLPAATVP